MAIRSHNEPVEVVTDRAPALRAAIEELLPTAFDNTEQYANNRGTMADSSLDSAQCAG